MANNNAIYTQGCNFGNLLEKGVDPRTGQYSCAISVWEAPAQARNCPPFKLTLTFNSLDSFDFGLGEGWSFNFTYYDHRKRSLYLSTGERFRVTETSTSVSVPDQKLKSFVFRKLDSGYQLTHKSGQTEILNDNNGTFDKCVPYEIYAANGCLLKPVWGRLGEHPRLVKIQESSQDLLTVDYESTTRKLVRFPDTPEESTFQIRLQANCLERLSLPLTDASWNFDYLKLGQSVCITKVTSPTGLVEEITHKADGHKLPTGAPMSYVPYVTMHIEKPGQSQPAITTRYEFSARNFLGYDGGFRWKDGEDNLYRSRDDYQYSSSVIVDGGSTTTNTYNRFHLIVSSEQKKGYTTVLESIKYYATDHGTFESQPPQCHLPKSIEKKFVDKSSQTPRSRSETTQFEYDEWGNPTKEVRPDGVKVLRTYYPAEGEASNDSADLGCPADPNGFKRYMATESIVPADSDYPAPTRTDKYCYDQIVTADGAKTSYFVSAVQHLSTDGNQILSRTVLAYLNEPTSVNHGRLNQQVTYHLDGFPITKKWNFESQDTNELAIRTSITNFDGTGVKEETVYSTLHGLTLAHKDEAGVEERFEYNLLGQIVKATTSPGTSYETSRSYEYILLQDAKGTQTTVTDAKGVQTRHISDGLERACLVEKQDSDELGSGADYAFSDGFRTVERRNYNAQGQCIEVAEIDWLRSDNGDPIPQESIQQLEYDDWGQVSKTTESNGAVMLSQSDPVDLTETRGIKDEGSTITYRDVSGNDIQIRLCESDGSVYSEVKKRYDGLGRLVEEEDQLERVIKYESDSFDRILTTTWPDGRVSRTTYANHSEDRLPAKVSINNVSLAEQSFDGLGRVTLQHIGPRTVTQTYKGNEPEPVQVTNAQGDECQIKYESALQFVPRSLSRRESTDTYEYDPQSMVPTLLKGAHSTQTREYTSSSRLKHETIELSGAETFFSEYQYSMSGKLQRYVNPHNQTQSVKYDDSGRPACLEQGNIKVSFTYDKASRLSKYSVEENSIVFDFSLAYDEFGREIDRVIRRKEEIVCRLHQTYSQTGLIETRLVKGNEGVSLQEENFKYDDRNRLVEYTCEGTHPPIDGRGNQLQTQIFSFDNYDNIVGMTTSFQDGGHNVTTYTYSKDDPTQLTEITNTNNTYPSQIDLEYDTNGCLTRDEQGRRLEYDSLCRLSTVRDEKENKICEYHYDAAGKLICQLVPDEPNNYLFYRGDSLIATRVGERRISYVSDGKAYWGQIIQDGETEKQQTQLWMADSHDSVLGWLDSHQPDTIHHQSYTPYGLGAHSSIGFNGQWRDPVTGWYHLGNGYRIYNPVLMRFHTPDPWSPFVSGEINPYTYSLGDPSNHVDPSGHFSLFGIHFGWKKLIAAILGLVASIATGILTAGASLAVQVGVGAVAGGVASATGGALGDLAEGRTPTWSSVGKDFLMGAAGGAAGPALGRLGGAVTSRVGKFLGQSPTSYTVSKAIAGHGLQDIVKQSVKGAAKGLVGGQTISLAWEAFNANVIYKRPSQTASKSGSGGESQVSRPEQIRLPYVKVGSSLGRDTIRPLLKNGHNALAGYMIQASASSMSSSYAAKPTSGQSVAEILNLSFRCSFDLSRKERDSEDDSALYSSVRGALRSPADWES
ncbi:RHS repeat protein [Aspergillus sclerotioniger CBS 115572]|uniref:RHS repeat protein n=1 Tax=Aspergillus sclerotioniger CBS 115572 TaxID=1450535 RepID=A0A317VCL0_9EURO|nr:RHS repeat protein [Aspergillus sclerotioniger CBS 115572]PWY69620.1 RHS repeat protein [Aspergillus sclerotioniger CBS 115572]